jgi:hypothetical protein
MKVKKKESTDYGLFCFRISKEERDELNELLDRAKSRLNKDKKPDEYVVTKSQILFEAIKKGLPLVKKE